MPKNAQNRLHVSMIPPHACVNDTPSSCGNVGEELLRQLANVAGACACSSWIRAAVVVDRVVAAPQHPVVAGQPEVVELVAHVGRAARAVPAEAASCARTAARSSARSPRPGSRRRRSGAAASGRNAPVPRTTVPARTRPVRGRQRRDRRPRRPADRAGRRVLVDPHARVQAGAAQPPGRAGRARPSRCRPCTAARRRTAGELSSRRPRPRRAPRRRGRAPGRRPPPRPGRRAARRGREVQLPGRLEVAVDAVGGDRLADLAQVLLAEPLEQRHLRGEPLEAVGDAVGEAGRAEAAVAAGRRPADGPRLEQHDVPGRVALPASSAVHRPVNPPPTTARSAVTRPASAGSGSGASGWSSQNDRGAAPASDRATCGLIIVRLSHTSRLQTGGGSSGTYRGSGRKDTS